jgi:serine/threonine-protein kinase
MAVLAEKPTSPSAPLPSLLPSQNEERHTVKAPENSPPLPQGTPAALSKAAACALLVASFAWTEAGCSGVQLRPEPGKACPEDTMKAMEKELGWEVESTQPGILIDVTKPHPDDLGEERTHENTRAVFKDGPVTGALYEAEGKAPKGTRLEGHLWTTGDQIYGRYYHAHLPNGRTVPICLEIADSSTSVGTDKVEGSKPGHAVGRRVVNGWLPERWR